MQVMMKLKKIATPPNDGVVLLWIRLGPGTENNFFSLEYLITNGKKANEIRKAVMPAITGVSIDLKIPR